MERGDFPFTEDQLHEELRDVLLTHGVRPFSRALARDLYASLLVLVREADSLDAAWQEAEAALPEGWEIWLHPYVLGDGYAAKGRLHGLWYMANGPGPAVEASGPTPAAALRALAQKLREAR